MTMTPYQKFQAKFEKHLLDYLFLMKQEIEDEGGIATLDEAIERQLKKVQVLEEIINRK